MSVIAPPPPEFYPTQPGEPEPDDPERNPTSPPEVPRVPKPGIFPPGPTAPEPQPE